MNRTRLSALVVLLLLTVLSEPLLAAMARNIDAAGARRLIAERPDLFILDVRTPEEFAGVRLEGAVLIPIDQVVKRIAEIPRNRPVLVYCAVGSRSSQVAGYLARLGYSEVYNLYGGIWGWRLRGYPVLKGLP
ncbi:rhodanese-related sulfurtransferase [Geothermobacter ehrlichii]|uniref:Rhodanese-related sulfurtransferase n=1 Tax=Geothermobacter ehrlichii TaxID=213224 RepID=A0A5D3WLA9_9BACT|nr:rhodanese-like domain-containing protein [Geothermobacter ehrlichii]TYO98293.1 rhodanese-related sulfurtransferase [Geothermobacter ehrlichii]